MRNNSFKSASENWLFGWRNKVTYVLKASRGGERISDQVSAPFAFLHLDLIENVQNNPQEFFHFYIFPSELKIGCFFTIHQKCQWFNSPECQLTKSLLCHFETFLHSLSLLPEFVNERVTNTGFKVFLEMSSAFDGTGVKLASTNIANLWRTKNKQRGEGEPKIVEIL